MKEFMSTKEKLIEYQEAYSRGVDQKTLEFILALMDENDAYNQMVIDLLHSNNELMQQSGNISDDKTEVKEEIKQTDPVIPQDVKDALNMKVDLFNQWPDCRYLADMTLEEIYESKGDKKAQSKWKWLLNKCDNQQYKSAAWKVQTFKINGRAV